MKNSEISVIVQGQVYGNINDEYENQYTRRVCESVRTVLPGAQLILSTWEYCDTEGIDCDVLIKIPTKDDPGSIGSNFNRQQMTTMYGLKAAANKYVLKLRSETVLENRNFIQIYEECENLKYGKYHFLKNRVVIDGVNPGWTGAIFHMSDHIFFGLKEDVANIWSIPGVNKDVYWGDGDATHIMMNPHRFLTLSFIKKYVDVSLNNYKDINKQNRVLWGKIVADNFISMHSLEYRVMSLKYASKRKTRLTTKSLINNFSYTQWKHLCKRYADSNIDMPHFQLVEIVSVCMGYLLWIKMKIKARMSYIF